MKIFIFLLIFELVGLLKSDINVLSPEDRCIANIRKEIKGRNVSRNLGGIVGIGWDDLTNTATLPIFSISYKQCRTVPDGDFLIPDNVIVFPIKEANIQQASSIYDTFNAFKADFSGGFKSSIGIGISGFGGSGSMSMEQQVGKQHMEQHELKCFSNTVEYHAFNLIATESAGFEKSFTDRLEEIAENVKDGTFLLAQYNAESLIGDYGTHVTNKALAGASIKMLSFTKAENETDKLETKTKLSASFQANIMGIAKSSMEMHASLGLDFESKSYSSSSQTLLITKGGPDVNKLFSQSPDGGKLFIDTVVGLTREGIPLFNLIHRGVLNGYDPKTMRMVQDLIYNATQEYYKHNTFPGCTTVHKLNYFYKANIYDGQCSNSDHFYDYFIGGVFQKCQYISSSSERHPALPNGHHCDEYNLPNPFTKNYTCMEFFDETPMESFYVTFQNRIHSLNDSNCNGTICQKNYTITDEIKVTAFWCKFNQLKDGKLNEDKPETAVKFGGIYSSDNVFSDNKGCPEGFLDYPFLHNLKICMTRYNVRRDEDNDLIWEDGNDAVAFGGIITCHDKFGQCPDYFSRYLAATIDGCSYYYCARVGEYYPITSMPSVRKPPYVDRNLAMSDTRFSYRQKTQKFEGNFENFEDKIIE